MSGRNIRELERNNLLLSPSARVPSGKTYQLIYRVSGSLTRTRRAIKARLDRSENWIRIGEATTASNTISFSVKAKLNRNAFTIDGMLADLRTVDPFGSGRATLTYIVPINLGTQAERAPQDNTATAAQTQEHKRTVIGETIGRITAIPGKFVGGVGRLFGFVFSRGLVVLIVVIIGVFFVLPRVTPGLVKALK